MLRARRITALRRRPVAPIFVAAVLASTCAHAQFPEPIEEHVEAAATMENPSAPAGPRDAARGATLSDERLEPQVAVFGIVVGDEPRAYAVSDLANSGAAIHDLVAASRIDVGMDGGEALVMRTDTPIREHRRTTWREWIRQHPDSSLWRPPAIAEPEANLPAEKIHVTESHHYKTGIGCGLVQARLVTTGMEPPGLFVISGTIENVSDQPVHHVVLRYELVDEDGNVLYRDEGFNRSAEALAAPRLTNAGAVIPIDSGKTDTFRMIFLSDELPAFARTRVTVSRVY